MNKSADAARHTASSGINAASLSEFAKSVLGLRFPLVLMKAFHAAEHKVGVFKAVLGREHSRALEAASRRVLAVISDHTPLQGKVRHR